MIDREVIGKLMHESWSVTKRAEGFHGPQEACTFDKKASGHIDYRGFTDATAVRDECNKPARRCPYFHADLVPWEQLPEKQKDINRHAFDAVLSYFEQRIDQLRNLQPSSDALKKMLLRVAERVQQEAKAEVYASQQIGSRQTAYGAVCALDLDRIVESFVNGTENGR